METPNIDFDASRREREKVEKSIYKLWEKWDKQEGPTEEEREKIIGELRNRTYSNDGYTSAYEEYTSPEVEALMGYPYKDMAIVEFLQL